MFSPSLEANNLQFSFIERNEINNNNFKVEVQDIPESTGYHNLNKVSHHHYEGPLYDYPRILQLC